MRCPACGADVHIGDAACGACNWNLRKIYTGERPPFGRSVLAREGSVPRRGGERPAAGSVAPARAEDSAGGAVRPSSAGGAVRPNSAGGAVRPNSAGGARRDRPVGSSESSQGRAAGSGDPSARLPAQPMRTGEHRPPRVSIDTKLGGALDLDLCDRLFLDRYDIGSLDPEFLHQSTVLCVTAEEFAEVLIEDLRISASQREVLLAGVAAGGNPHAEGTLGVYLPGRGCFLNGNALRVQAGVATISALLSEPAARRAVVRTAVHEKLGHGFLAEASAVGSERRANGLERLRLARGFGVETVDSPAHEILRRKYAMLFDASVFVDEGFSRWLETDLLAVVEHAQGVGGETSASAGTNLAVAPVDPRPLLGMDERLDTFLRWAFDPPDDLNRSRDGALFAAAFLAASESEALLRRVIERVTGMAPRYSLGALLMEAIAQRHRRELVPAAALIAYNVAMGLGELAVADLRELLADARFHMTARACQLVALPSCSTAAELAACANECLAFPPPPCLVG